MLEREDGTINKYSKATDDSYYDHQIEGGPWGWTNYNNSQNDGYLAFYIQQNKSEGPFYTIRRLTIKYFHRKYSLLANTYTKAECDAKFTTKVVSQTVTHDTVPEEDINKYQIGRPVFLSGSAYMNRNNSWIPSQNAPTDCICGVKTTGTWKEYVGVVTNVDKENNMVEFATHGDFYFTVDDSRLNLQPMVTFTLPLMIAVNTKSVTQSFMTEESLTMT